MKKFTIPCDFGDKKAPFDVYIGMPNSNFHALHFQELWLAENRGGKIPSAVMESFAKLLVLAQKNQVSFEDLCVYAMEAAHEEKKKIELENLNADDKDLREINSLQKFNEVRLLASADQLRNVFNDDFNLMLVLCKDFAGNTYHAILLIRADKTLTFCKLVEDDKIKLHEMDQHGMVEYVGRGSHPDAQTIQGVSQKYNCKILIL